MKNEIINDYKGESVYACDLAYTLFESYNIDGSVTYNTYEAEQWIKKHFDELGEIVEEIKFQLGGEFIPNIFDEPEKFMVVVYLEVASQVLAQCEFIDNNWNNTIELNENNITIIKEQLKGVL